MWLPPPVMSPDLPKPGQLERAHSGHSAATLPLDDNWIARLRDRHPGTSFGPAAIGHRSRPLFARARKWELTRTHNRETLGRYAASLRQYKGGHNKSSKIPARKSLLGYG